jgi:hypothetical protein
MYLCSNWVRTRAARVISVMRSGSAVMCWRAAQRWVSGASPRSPWQRRPRRGALRVRVPASSCWFPGGVLHGGEDAGRPQRMPGGRRPRARRPLAAGP